ncbi:polysaccharide pyruvyl transferase family protein [Vibrio sp. Y176]|uniref:polysaccharide pyruvyl transferase family protein n=1 Tax=Vibrio sp. Y176 TaxID=3074704 RepID=UPI002965CD9D|nr:polysaccharide pyruvyl transferase family protein [Vibrio sp. Y176]MDW1628895.1 polysaccharide pyruvyl transferase family protein [Vibrio sp. Y176]
MKILHIAAFEGNIGDNASHLGFISILERLLDSYTIDRLEIRKAYKNYTGEDKIEFDDDFAHLANSYDLVVFGGGGFLDYWVKDSSNGTTIDIEIEVLKKIRTQILITSVGCNPHREVPDENFGKFKRFLDHVKTAENIQIALRNDGSVDSIRRDFGEEYLESLVEILDHGYFYEPKDDFLLPIDCKYIAINVTDDQLNMQGGISENRDWYYKEIQKTIESIVLIGYKIVFVPHIHQDIEAIGTILSKLPNNLVRAHTIIAPCLQNDKGTDIAFNLYKNADFVIASRYHANVCAIKFGVPTIGLSPLKRIEYTHKQLLSKCTNVEITEGFSQVILQLIKCFDFEDIAYDSILKDKKAETIEFYRSFFEEKVNLFN